MENSFANFKNLFFKSKSILILLPRRPSADATAAALSFYLSLKEAGKQTIVAAPEPINVALNRLVAVDKITDQIGSRNLVASFDYIEDSIEKVSYHIAEGKFNLVIEPKENFPPLDPEKVSYSYSGAASDLIIVIGAQKLENLGRLYDGEKKVFTDKETVNIDVSINNTRFGKTNLVDPQASSASELVGNLIKNLNLPVNADIATNLLAGIETATRNLAFKTRAETFEIVAWCLKNGGRRGQLRTTAPAQPLNARQFMRPPQQPAGKQPLRQPAPSAPVTAPQTAFQPTPPSPTTSAPAGKPSTDRPAPPEWLKPKIYKGNTPVK